ncbi:uncharacterized protein METZ01_LOCUS277040, partial [marine metagenome]
FRIKAIFLSIYIITDEPESSLWRISK